MASTRIHIDEARLGRVQKQDRIATGVLTAIAAIRTDAAAHLEG